MDDCPLAVQAITSGGHWSCTRSQLPKLPFAIKLADLFSSISQGSGSPTALLKIALKEITVGDLYPGSLFIDSSFLKRTDDVKLVEPVHNGSVFILRDSMDYGIEVKFGVIVFADIDNLIADA